jgi:23S rRNA (guanosine2251-2'-O)-methyltransferase
MADRDGPRERRDFGAGRPRRNFDRAGPRRDFEGRGPRRDFDRSGPRRDFDRDRPRRDGDFGADRPRREFDRDRPRREFERDQPGRHFDRPRRPSFGGPPDRGVGADRRPYRPPPGPRPSPVAAADFLADDEELVAGRRPVGEVFAARREARRLLVVPERRAALEAIVLHATTLRLPIVEVEGGTLTSLTGFDGHQGVALVVARRQPASVDDLLERARARGEDAFVLVLDSLEDPQNLGTLLRSAEACGVHGIVYPTRHAAPLTSAAIKSSAGASEHLLLAAVDSLPATLADLRAAGLRLVGADEGAALRYSEADFRGPLALVVGSEERGISGALRRRLDMTVRIPMRGRVASLNAAVAGSVLLFAAAEQRGVPESGDRPEPEPSALPPEAERGDSPSTEALVTDAADDAAADDAAAADVAADDAASDELLPGGPLPDEQEGAADAGDQPGTG